jgi:hypothetical protein
MPVQILPLKLSDLLLMLWKLLLQVVQEVAAEVEVVGLVRPGGPVLHDLLDEGIDNFGEMGLDILGDEEGLWLQLGEECLQILKLKDDGVIVGVFGVEEATHLL